MISLDQWLVQVKDSSSPQAGELASLWVAPGGTGGRKGEKLADSVEAS